jgi:hypothetical protein
MATSIPLNTLQPPIPTALAGHVSQGASNASSAASSGTVPGGQASVTHASNSITPNATLSSPTAPTQAGSATAQPASIPIAVTKAYRWLERIVDFLHTLCIRCRRWLERVVDFPHTLFIKCRRSKAIQRLQYTTSKTWRGFFTLALAVVTFVLTTYYCVVRYKAAQVSNTVAKKALLYTVWTAENDFRGACASDRDAGRPISATCNEALASPAQPPPTLTKRALEQAWETACRSAFSFHSAWITISICFAYYIMRCLSGMGVSLLHVLPLLGISAILVALLSLYEYSMAWLHIVDASQRCLLGFMALFSIFTLLVSVLAMRLSLRSPTKHKIP